MSEGGSNTPARSHTAPTRRRARGKKNNECVCVVEGEAHVVVRELSQTNCRVYLGLIDMHQEHSSFFVKRKQRFTEASAHAKEICVLGVLTCF